MINIFKHSIRFVFFVLVQALIFNQLEIGWGIQFMIYPLYIMLLPWDANIFITMLIAFAMGISIDSFANTFGLHASSAVLVAFLRPYFFKMFESRDGYEPGQEMTALSMEFSWIVSFQGLILIVHHLWFFLIEIFKFNEILYILQKSALSIPASFILCIFIQMLFLRRNK